MSLSRLIQRACLHRHARFFIGLAITLSLASSAEFTRAAPPEVRATWLTTTGNDAISTPQKTADTMKRLRAIGLNTVYVECWKNGYTEFPSETMRKAIGVPLKINGDHAQQRDLLQETLTEAHRNQLLHIAWFEYGFMAAFRDTHNELRARRDWISLNQQGGDVAKNGFVWLNPLHPDAQNLLIGIVTEAVTKYDLDGIQLDDRIVWPSLEMGYDDFTKKAYATDHDGHEPPSDIHDKQWCTWRAKKVTEFSKRFVMAVRAANPHILISLSPGPYPWAYDNYLCDWVNWSKWNGSPTWDEYVPQLYRMDYATFEKDWRAQIDLMPDHKSQLIAGIRLVGDGPDLPNGDAVKSAQLVRDTGGAGHCWWFSRGVLGSYEKEIADFYDVPHNGQAPHPSRIPVRVPLPSSP